MTLYKKEILLNTDFISNINDIPTSTINNWETINSELIQYTLNSKDKIGVKIKNISGAELKQISQTDVIQVGIYTIILNIDLLN
jgi:hypothetical protein